MQWLTQTAAELNNYRVSTVLQSSLDSSPSSHAIRHCKFLHYQKQGHISRNKESRSCPLERKTVPWKSISSAEDWGLTAMTQLNMSCLAYSRIWPLWGGITTFSLGEVLELVAITQECPLFAESYKRSQEPGATRVQIYKIFVRKDCKSPNFLCMFCFFNWKTWLYPTGTYKGMIHL